MDIFENMTGHYLGERALPLIADARIGIAGCGGLGSNIAHMLIRTGFTSMTLVDYDVVEAFNLNRQFFFSNQIGTPKALALKHNLQAINPNAQINISFDKVGKSNIRSLFSGHNIVIEALDNVEGKVVMASQFKRSRKLFICFSGIAGYGMDGVDGIRIRRIGRNAFVIGDGETGVDEQHPPMSARVNIAAAKCVEVILEHTLRT